MPEPESNVLRVGDISAIDLHHLFADYGLELTRVADNRVIPGTFWGEPEAGLIGHTLYYRDDTPVHSVLHEACHFICMPESRRETLHTNAGGTNDEESAVCYLQILMADAVPALGRDRLLADMDAWGYSFRLGSARRWFEEDAGDAFDWLSERDLIPLKTDRSAGPSESSVRRSLTR